MPDDALILAPPAPIDKIKLNPEGAQMLERALAGSALIVRVTNADENTVAARAQADLKSVVSALDKAGKAIRDPHTKFCKDVIAFVEETTKEAVQELDRISNTIASFHQLEIAKQRAAENVARLERERIENELRAEERRLREEAVAAQRALDEQAAEARRQAQAARNAEEQAKAEALQREIERQKALATAANHDAMDAIQEKFNDQAAQIAAPVRESVRAEGQRISTDWEITRINEHQLAKARPDLVRNFEFDMRAVKAELTRGVKLPGVEAKEVVSASVRAGAGKAIDV